MPARKSAPPAPPAHTAGLEQAADALAETAARPRADWAAIEGDYRRGIRSLRTIAAEHGITEAAIRKRARRDDWTRDLQAKVHAKADALVRRETVRRERAEAVRRAAEVRKAEGRARKEAEREARRRPRGDNATEKQTVEVEAQVEARIRIAHRSDIARSRALAMKLLAELEHQTDRQDLYEHLADIVLVEDGAGGAATQRRMEAFQRAMSLSGRADVLKRLAETLRILIDKEREAYGILPPTPGDQQPGSAADAVRSFFAALHGARLPITRSEPADVVAPPPQLLGAG